jgi:hypothetical protein
MRLISWLSSVAEAVRRPLSRLYPWTKKPSIELALIRHQSLVLVAAPPGVSVGRVSAHLMRLMVLLDGVPAHPKVGPKDTIVDTGSYLTIFPEAYWQKVVERITELKSYHGGPLPAWLTTVKGKGGARIPCKPGLLLVRLMDGNGRVLPPINIVALFASDAGTLKHIVLGLDGGLLREHGMELVFDGHKVWLTER